MEDIRQCFIRDPNSNKIRFTAVGKQKFAQRFARRGFDIASIKTSDQFVTALNATTSAELTELRDDKNSEPALKEMLTRVID